MLPLLLLTQAISYAPPAPPVYVAQDVTSGERTRLAVLVKAPGAILWDGTLWVATRGASSFRQTVQEPQPEGCPRTPSFGYGAQNEVSVQLSSERGGQAAMLAVTVRWARPVEEGCGGTRTVELREAVPMPGSTPVVLRGDGGLVVELRRR